MRLLIFLVLLVFMLEVLPATSDNLIRTRRSLKFGPTYYTPNQLTYYAEESESSSNPGSTYYMPNQFTYFPEESRQSLNFEPTFYPPSHLTYFAEECSSCSAGQLFDETPIIGFISQIKSIFITAVREAPQQGLNVILVTINRFSEQRSVFYSIIDQQVDVTIEKITYIQYEARREIQVIVQNGQQSVHIQEEVSSELQSVETNAAKYVEEVVQERTQACTQLRTTLREITEKFLSLSAEMRECENTQIGGIKRFFQKSKCFVSLIATVYTRGVEILNSIVSVVVEVKEFVKTLPGSIDKCIANTTVEVETIIDKINSNVPGRSPTGPIREPAPVVQPIAKLPETPLPKPTKPITEPAPVVQPKPPETPMPEPAKPIAEPVVPPIAKLPERPMPEPTKPIEEPPETPLPVQEPTKPITEPASVVQPIAKPPEMSITEPTKPIAAAPVVQPIAKLPETPLPKPTEPIAEPAPVVQPIPKPPETPMPEPTKPIAEPAPVVEPNAKPPVTPLPQPTEPITEPAAVVEPITKPPETPLPKPTEPIAEPAPVVQPITKPPETPLPKPTEPIAEPAPVVQPIAKPPEIPVLEPTNPISEPAPAVQPIAKPPETLMPEATKPIAEPAPVDEPITKPPETPLQKPSEPIAEPAPVVQPIAKPPENPVPEPKKPISEPAPVVQPIAKPPEIVMPEPTKPIAKPAPVDEPIAIPPETPLPKPTEPIAEPAPIVQPIAKPPENPVPEPTKPISEPAPVVQPIAKPPEIVMPEPTKPIAEPASVDEPIAIPPETPLPKPTEPITEPAPVVQPIAKPPENPVPEPTKPISEPAPVVQPIVKPPEIAIPEPIKPIAQPPPVVQPITKPPEIPISVPGLPRPEPIAVSPPNGISLTPPIFWGPIPRFILPDIQPTDDEPSRCNSRQTGTATIQWVCAPEKKPATLPVLAPESMSPCQSSLGSNGCLPMSHTIFSRPPFFSFSRFSAQSLRINLPYPPYTVYPATPSFGWQASDQSDPELDSKGFPPGELITLEIITSVTKTICESQGSSNESLFDSCPIATFIDGIAKMFSAAAISSDANIVRVIFEKASSMRTTFHSVIKTQVQLVSDKIITLGREGRVKIEAIVLNSKETVQSKVTDEISNEFVTIQTTESSHVEEIVGTGIGTIDKMVQILFEESDEFFSINESVVFDASLAVRGLETFNSFRLEITIVEGFVMTVPELIDICIKQTTEDVKAIETKLGNCETCDKQSGYWLYQSYG